MTPCMPSQARPECENCMRYRPDLPQLAECRPATLVIDMTVIRRKPEEPCAMRVEWEQAA